MYQTILIKKKLILGKFFNLTDGNENSKNFNQRLIKKKKIKFWRICELRFDRRKVGSDVGENSMNLHNPMVGRLDRMRGIFFTPRV